ncbi:hypothetical protein ACH4VT_36300 [Streptomyces lydicus]|uniref:hypothetical protein n=1 Tax=Streptomyces lydicus TaxID=47763 RepID=UPI0037BD83A5
MPVEPLPRFTTDRQHLPPAQRRRLTRSSSTLCPGLRTGLFRPGLRIKGLRVAPGI